MYNELLPYWKQRCWEFHTNPIGSVWVNALARKGIYHGSVFKPLENAVGCYEWVLSESDYHYHDCLVLGIMLFTWEAGLEP